MQGSGFAVQGSGFGVKDAWFRVQGAEFGVQGSGIRVQGAGFRVQVAGCRVHHHGWRPAQRRSIAEREADGMELRLLPHDGHALAARHGHLEDQRAHLLQV